MQIHQIKGRKLKKSKTVGRGGKRGTYCGRGGKGQSARSGYSRRATFEGGRTTIVAQSKKFRGFKSKAEKNQIVSLDLIENKFETGQTIDPASLKKVGLIANLKRKVKILTKGTITKKFNFKGVLFSKSAKEQVEKTGSTIEA